ncbi:hypothetical protein BBI17_005028 [Phytophthora kernoviae]|uniref:Uncharacterized protein n=1 Tax=Phytophthora kernoviae TaxID=325452 RepID=A0A3R7GII3_9STRA|nr:hypothetical protein BBI17_005028 [Phytophthora kernoviae]
MLVNGSVEWGEALFATGVKANLLRDGYNTKLHVAATPLGSSVAITRYSELNAVPGFAPGILDQPSDRIVLHEDTSNGNPGNALPVGRVVKWINREGFAGDCFSLTGGNLGGGCHKVLVMILFMS